MSYLTFCHVCVKWVRSDTRRTDAQLKKHTEETAQLLYTELHSIIRFKLR